MTTTLLLTVASIVTIVCVLLVLEVGPFLSLLWGESASRLAPFRERLARAWADLKFSLVQRVKAGARLAALLWHILVGALVLIPSAALVFLGYAVGMLLSPLRFFHDAFWQPLTEAYEDSGDRLMAGLDRAYWRGRDALAAVRGQLAGQ